MSVRRVRRLKTELRLLEKEEDDRLGFEINQVCPCGERISDSILQWRYRVHRVTHYVKKIGAIAGSALMTGMTMGSVGDSSRNSQGGSAES